MSNSSRRLSRGDRRRNDRLAALRAVITRHSAVLAFDLAADKQVCALTDQDSRVLARRTVKAKAWQLREAVEWGMAQAAAAGLSSVVVACEPTGYRWRVLDQIAAEAGARLVCVQPLLVHRARESEDFTRNKSDETDAMIIARLVTELRCYLPERVEPVWARLRHLGARRAGLVADTTCADRLSQGLDDDAGVVVGPRYVERCTILAERDSAVAMPGTEVIGNVPKVPVRFETEQTSRLDAPVHQVPCQLQRRSKGAAG